MIKVFNNEMAGSLCQPKFDQRQDKSNRLIKKKKITNTSSGCIEKKNNTSSRSIATAEITVHHYSFLVKYN